ncbi:uncharacterized protein DNG_02293 [Cephalotrichum gorgonifer]|uniref:Uncharacterized protein n=1 Tax=Cephalotrichum gorgonifer TaxID=2041049 RepID=A0AAE8SSG8_9PEZI|nr:uncharacterized protein DNG_02293 [Cephalotrichum gorgonifer]
MVFLTLYLLQACSSPDLSEAGIGRARSNGASPSANHDGCDVEKGSSCDTPDSADMGGELEETYEWGTVDTITIDIDEQDMPNLPYAGDGNRRNIFGHTTFRVSREWPNFIDPPVGVSNPRYSTAYRIAADIFGSLHLMAGSNYEYASVGKLLYANVGKINILVNGVVYESIDVNIYLRLLRGE